MGLGNAIS
jgi:chromosome segregation ATPase